MQDQVSAEDLLIHSGDYQLSARLFHAKEQPEVTVVLNGATGVPRDYYRHFASWLALERGIACLTYDYRDFGHSLTGNLKKSKSSMTDWALVDMPAARTEMRRRFPNSKLWVIGHSIGGMLGPLQPGIEEIDRMICVCSGLVQHRDHPWPYQALARMFWFGHVPLLVKSLGYLPGRLVGFGADLPAPVYWQWRKWCISAKSYLPDAGTTLPKPDWKRSGASVDMIAFSDDQVIPPKCVWRLAELYGQDARRRELTPQDFGVKQIGHLGAFARKNAVVWPALIAD